MVAYGVSLCQVLPGGSLSPWFVRPPWGRVWGMVAFPRVRLRLTRGYREVRPLRGRCFGGDSAGGGSVVGAVGCALADGGLVVGAVGCALAGGGLVVGAVGCALAGGGLVAGAVGRKAAALLYNRG